ncbi:MAG TPA: hypothetical protein VGN72_06550 [Tepidisphaeraceae bacterium]|jgi:hypothetical protein|nr:hypothetical protein [Tepidisphaeraceae bacterium]
MKDLITREITPPPSHEEYRADIERRIAEANAPKGKAPSKPADEPTFAGKPLSYFADKSDEQILADKSVRVGEKTLKDIRDAQRSQK